MIAAAAAAREDELEGRRWSCVDGSFTPRRPP